MKLYRDFFKRVIDIAASGCGLFVLSPVLAGVTFWLHFANKGAGAFFFQERPGKGGKIFRVVKFKSMTDERDEHGELLPNEKRLTKVGAFIRKTSIDELPQLWNVFAGDMSLIGPRPLLPEYLPYYTAEEKHRHDVRPGITGWAQINGRNHVDWDNRLELDIWYVNHISLITDMKIVYRTILNIIMRKDVEVAPKGIPLNIYRKQQSHAK